MNPFRLLLGSILLAATAAGAAAAFQPVRPDPENRMPLFPTPLKTEGITKGRALVALSVDAAGRVDDTLVVAYTHERFARATLEAIRDWRFAPAQLDGRAVPVHTEITFEFSLEGAMISSDTVNPAFFGGFETPADSALTYRPADVRSLDRPPQRVAGELPDYASTAEQEGVKGKVRVRFYIDEQGQVRLPAATSEAHPYLAEQAVKAVKTWKFEPVTRRGQPVLVVAEQEFSFGAPLGADAKF